MSLADIEAELDSLSPIELRELALKSWSAFLEKGGTAEEAAACSEGDPQLLAGLDEAIATADTSPGEGRSADEIRTALREWITK